MENPVAVDDLKGRYPGEWVLLAEPQVDSDLRVVRGVLRYHSPVRDQAERFAIESGCVAGAVLFLGEPPRDAVFAL